MLRRCLIPAVALCPCAGGARSAVAVRPKSAAAMHAAVRRPVAAAAAAARRPPRTTTQSFLVPSQVGVLQLPRTRGERLRHLEVLDKVPFDLVPAYEERAKLASKREAARGPIGKIFRRYREDATTVLIGTMLQACVERRYDAMLWDTVAGTLRDEMPHMTAVDIGIALACLVKANYRRDENLILELMRRLAISVSSVAPAVAAGANPGRPRSSDRTIGGGRRHRRARSSELGAIVGARPFRAPTFSEHALSAGLGALHHFGLGEPSADIVAKLCAVAQRSCSSISTHTLCKIVHHAGGLVSAPHRGGDRQRSGAAARLLDKLRPELCTRFGRCRLLDDSDECTAGDLCLVVHAYAHSPGDAADRPLFVALQARLTDVVLLQLSAGQLAGLANSFGKLTQAADLDYVPLFDSLGRQLAEAVEMVGLRDACVALNAFAQASVRHEPLFFALEGRVPALLHERDCDMRQLAMLAHAYVRVGLPQSSLLPLVYDRAARLAPRSNAHSLALMLFAVTKGSAVGDAGGAVLLGEIASRLLALLGGSAARSAADHSAVESTTVAVVTYALARGGCAALVDPALWCALAKAAEAGLAELGISDAANVASALAQAMKAAPGAAVVANEDIASFFVSLRRRLEVEVLGTQAHNWLRAKGRGPAPIVLAKLIIAFGEMRCMCAGQVAHHLARQLFVLGPPSQRLGVGPLRGVAEALARLHVHDEDLIQALTFAQQRGPRSGQPLNMPQLSS